MALRRICDLRGVLRPARLAAPVKAPASPKPSPLAAARRWFTSSTPARAPGPIARFNAQYSEWLEKYPLVTKIVTSAAIGAAGDIGCQLFIEDRAFDFVRLAQFTALNGLLVGPSLHVWCVLAVVSEQGGVISSARALFHVVGDERKDGHDARERERG